MYFYKGFNDCVPRPPGRGRGRAGAGALFAPHSHHILAATGSPDAGAVGVPDRHLNCCHDISDVLSDRECTTRDLSMDRGPGSDH